MREGASLPRSGLLRALATGDRRQRWGRAWLFAFALQLRPAWVLLGAWLVSGGSSSAWPRVRFLPAHPDWYVPTLVESGVTAFVAMALARRFRAAGVLATAAVTGGLGWAFAFALMPNGLDGFSQLFRPPQEMLALGILLACLAVSWNRLGPWTAVPVVAIVAGVGVGAVPFLFSNTLFGVPWPEGWSGDLALHVCGVALVAVALALLRRRWLADDRPDGSSAVHSGSPATVVGSGGLLALALFHWAVGAVSSGWTTDDSARLLAASAALALLVAVAASRAWWAGSRAARPERG